MHQEVITVRSWRELKVIIDEQQPEFVAYVIEKNWPVSSEESVALRFIVPRANAQYVLYDSPEGEVLKETRIPLHEDKDGHMMVCEDDVKCYLKNELGSHKIIICSY